ncbi:MAG TPA: hypothetical protein VNJ12_06700 [Candidatus Dormibacteraeota bacterium]|nr:hypothetical protein [Candidatus Dormibacteraeota bacterium]
MKIREYRAEDLDHLRQMHARQGFRYPMPDVEDSSFLVRAVLEDDDGVPVMAALARLTSEVYLLADPEAATPRERFRRLLALHDAARREGWRRGLDDAHCWLPPRIAKGFGRRLGRLGWREPAWACYWLPLSFGSDGASRTAEGSAT